MNNKIYPSLWFEANSREIADFYCKVFSDSEVDFESPVVVILKLSGQKFMLINGGPIFSVNPTVSFYTVCETEEEINSVWEKLLDGGKALMPINSYGWSPRYGWVEDRYGVNWQLSLGKISDMGQKFTPSMMFTGKQNGNAREAIGFYTSLFSSSSVKAIYNYEKGEGDAEGNIKHAQFMLEGNGFIAMDSSFSDTLSFTEGLSFVVECENQEEIDHFWNSMTKEGEESQCGWLKDKYGFSWQIIPSMLGKFLNNPTLSKSSMDLFFSMKKINIAALLSEIN
jgi:predicted 3-demethylubiquinone-9 3-methyltransferase (glyoxalase superfamily)